MERKSGTSPQILALYFWNVRQKWHGLPDLKVYQDDINNTVPFASFESFVPLFLSRARTMNFLFTRKSEISDFVDFCQVGYLNMGFRSHQVDSNILLYSAIIGFWSKRTVRPQTVQIFNSRKILKILVLRIFV